MGAALLRKEDVSTSRGTVLVSGASGGIGAECARHLSALGYTVVAGVRKSPTADHQPTGVVNGLHYVHLDVTDAQSIARAVDFATSLGEGAGLAGLVNNAGISVMGPVEVLPLGAFRRQFEVNVFGTVALTQACLPALRVGKGRVVIMGSIAGRTSMAYSAAYSASKFALEALADALRLEVSRWGIQVSIIEPGAIATPIWDKVAESWEAAAENAPPNIRPLYDEAIAHMRTAVADYSRVAIGPDAVARRVAHALMSRRPRTRYLVGTEARLRAALQAWLPDRLHDALIRRVMRLP